MGGSSSANRFLVRGFRARFLFSCGISGPGSDGLFESSPDARRVKSHRLATTVFLSPMALKCLHGLIHPLCVAGALKNGLGREVFVLRSGIVSQRLEVSQRHQFLDGDGLKIEDVSCLSVINFSRQEAQVQELEFVTLLRGTFCSVNVVTHVFDFLVLNLMASFSVWIRAMFISVAFFQ
jgi:hypothetical protein